MTPDEIQSLRKHLALSQREFGEMLGIQGENVRNTVDKWETGVRPPTGPILAHMNTIKEMQS